MCLELAACAGAFALLSGGNPAPRLAPVVHVDRLFSRRDTSTVSQRPRSFFAGPLRQNQQDVCAYSWTYDWSVQFGSVTAARVLLMHHPDVFAGGEREEEESRKVPRLLELVVPLVASAVSDKHSVLQMNGLRCMAELFRCGSVVRFGVVALPCQAHGFGYCPRAWWPVPVWRRAWDRKPASSSKRKICSKTWL